jgi:xanthine phosphoribosyltransferase
MQLFDKISFIDKILNRWCRILKLLEERILKDGQVFPGNILKVDSFLNHQIDVKLLCEMGKEIKRLYGDAGINKILTIEASGIAIACIAAQYFDCPVLFAKKSKTKNIANTVYKTKVQSFTHGTEYDVILSKDFLSEKDNVLIIDDFLAEGNALLGLIDLCNQAGAKISGCAIAVEKGFQQGRERVEAKGIRVESLAIVQEMKDDAVIFRKQ